MIFRHCFPETHPGLVDNHPHRPEVHSGRSLVLAAVEDLVDLGTKHHFESALFFQPALSVVVYHIVDEACSWFAVSH